MRTVYLGTSLFAVAVLEILAQSDHRPLLVVTRPDRPKGRGRKLLPPPVADAARELGIDVFQPDSVNSDEGRARIAAEYSLDRMSRKYEALYEDLHVPGGELRDS